MELFVVPKSTPIASVVMQKCPAGRTRGGREGAPVSCAPIDEGFDPGGLAAARIRNHSILRNAAIAHRRWSVTGALHRVGDFGAQPHLAGEERLPHTGTNRCHGRPQKW